MLKRKHSTKPFSHAAKALTVAASISVLGACGINPVMLTDTETARQITADLQRLQADVEPFDRAITLDEAIARAIKYNREQRVKLMESALRRHEFKLSQYDMLPTLTAEAGYNARSNLLASSSESVLSGNQSLEPSTSSEKKNTTGDLMFSWNILDFGLSYVRAEQAADRSLIARERERKALHNIIEEVRSAYWRALSAQQLLRQVGPLMQRVNGALDSAKQIERRRVEKPLEALTYRRELIEMLRSMHGLRRDLAGAKTELATLIGAPNSEAFTLAPVPADGLRVPKFDVSMEDMESTALSKRPELNEARYQSRISGKETRAALLGLLPGINLNFGGHYDSNDFLVNDQWSNVSAAISWNLFNVFRGPSALAAADAQKVLAEEQRLAMSMALLGQTHLARIAYEQSIENYRISEDYLDVARKISKHVQAAGRAQQVGELQVIRQQLNAVLAELRRDVAHATLQNNYGRLFTSMGIDPLPEEVAGHDIRSLSEAVALRQREWRSNAAHLFVTNTEVTADPVAQLNDSDVLQGEANVVAEQSR